MYGNNGMNFAAAWLAVDAWNHLGFFIQRTALLFVCILFLTGSIRITLGALVLYLIGWLVFMFFLLYIMLRSKYGH